jgi:5-methylcytosine-specific restriction endonuclease McrA
MARKGAPTWDDFPRRKDDQGRPLCRKCGIVLTGRKTAWCGKICLKSVKMMVHWPSIRNAILRRDHRKCVKCGNSAWEVDHIVELADGGSFWDPANLQTLCEDHHKKKTSASRKVRALKKNSIKALKESNQ